MHIRAASLVLLLAVLSVVGLRAQTAPGAPTIGTAIGTSRAVVSFTAPADDGGSPITVYTATSSPGGITGTGTTSPIFVPGLTGGTAYTFTVTATNAIGTSSASAASNSMTPASTLIPAETATDWSYAGVGGIPNRTTVCATLDAATYGHGTIEAGPAIKAAIDACPVEQVVSIGAGTFLVNTYILHNKAVTVRGQGMGITVLKRTLVPQMPIMVIGGSRGTGIDQTSSVNLTTDAVKGTFSVNVSNPAGFAAGQFVLLDEDHYTNATYVPMPPGQPVPTSVLRTDRIAWARHLPEHSADCDLPPSSCMLSFTNSRIGRALAEVKEIKSVSGNTITFATPFHITYRVAYQSQLSRYVVANPHRTGGGVENLTMIGGTEGNLRFSGAAYAWAKGIECAYATQPCIAINDSTRIEVRDSFIHEEATRAPGGGGYLFSLQEGASEVLIENNIHITGNKVIVARAAGAGSVMGYNYMDNALISYNYGWMEAGINASHFAGSHHVLFEGNQSFSYASDDTWGNAIYMTVFRNHFTGARRDHTDTNMVNTVAMGSGSYWHALVGNVFGTPAMPPSGGGGTGPMAWVYEDLCDGTYGSGISQVCGNPKNPAIYRLGFWGKFWYTPGDPQVMSTIVRERNWDYLTDSVRSDRASPSTLPNSLYLTAKPAFFETADQWPWVDPIGATKTYTLPARRRYDAYRVNPGGGYSHTQSQYHHLTPALPSHTFTSNNTAGRSIIVGAGWLGSDVPTIADTRGNTYSLVVTKTNTSGFSSAIWAAHSIAAGANTVTLTHATSEIDAVFAEYAGLTGNDKSAGKPRSAGVPTSSGTDATTTANQLVFGFITADVVDGYGRLWSDRPAAGPTFTSRATGESARHYVGAEDRRTNFVGSYEADFTSVGSRGNPNPAEQQWIALVATFKEATGSPVVPSPPSIGTATAGVQQATVTFIPSASDGGSAITGYTVTSSPGGLTGTGLGSPITVTGLTANVAYTFTVTATNSIGTGPPSAASNSVTPTGATGYVHVQSVYGHAVSGVGAVTINVTAGNAVFVTAAWDSATLAVPTVSQGAVPGLRRHEVQGATSLAVWTSFNRPAGATTFTFTLTGATFDVMVSEYAGLQGTAIRVFGADGTGGTPSSGPAAASTIPTSLVFGVARHDGVMPTPGPGFTLRGTGSTGTVYLATEDRRVTAVGTYAADWGPTTSAWSTIVNVVGELVQADTTDPVVTITTPATTTVDVTTTPYPTISGTASDAVGVVACAWTNAAGGSGTATGTTAWSISNVALTLGANLITVACLDAAGNDGTDTVTINYVTVAGPPVMGTATAGNAQATVTFTPPGNNGGSAITGYTATSAPGDVTGTGAGSPITVTGLTNGTPYSFTVTATNAAGVSLPSAPSNQVTPVTVPGPPTIGIATAGSTTASVAFIPNALDGGSPVLYYTATSAPGALTGQGGASPVAVDALVTGTAYTFTVTATNAIGTSAASAASNSVTLTPPTEQRTLSADIYHFAPGPCFLRSGEGAPASNVGGVCDTYYQTDTPYTVFRKTASGTWAATSASGGGATPYTAGDLLVANSATTLGRVPTQAAGRVLATNGIGAVPAWTSGPTLTSIGGASNLTLNPAGDLLLGPAGNDILPLVGYTQNIGNLTRKFLTLHAAELWVETLVAQNTIATIGGRVLVGPTTVLVDGITGSDTTFTVKHNQLAIGDIVQMEAEGKFERMRITGGPSGTDGAWVYTIVRNLDVSIANAWTAGDAVFNTGVTGDGFIDLYSASSVIGSSVLGPSVAGIVRTGTNHNDLEPRWAIGNLNGLYGYGQNIMGAAFGDGKNTPTGPWLKIDANTVAEGGGGIRAGTAASTYFAIEPTGAAWFSGNLTVGTGGRNMLANSEFMRGRSTGDRDDSYWGGAASLADPGGLPSFTCAAPCQQIRNPPLSFEEDDGSTGFDNSTHLSVTLGVNLATWFPINGGAIWWTMNGTPPVGTYSRVWGPKIPASPGQRYEYSFYGGVLRGGQLSARLIWFDAFGGYLSESDGSIASATCNGLTGVGGQNLSGYCRAWNISDAPAGASFVVPTILQVYDTTTAPLGPQPFTFATRVYFGIAQAGQLQPSPWGPAGATLITGEMLSTDLVMANTTRSPGVLGFTSGGSGYWLDAGSPTPTFRVGGCVTDPDFPVCTATTTNRLAWDGTNLVIGQEALSIGPGGITLAPGSSLTWTPGPAYKFTLPDTGALGLSAYTQVTGSNRYRGLWSDAMFVNDLGALVDQAAHTFRAGIRDGATSEQTILDIVTTTNVSYVDIYTQANNGFLGVYGHLNLQIGASLSAASNQTNTAANLPTRPCGYIEVYYQNNRFLVPAYSPTATCANLEPALLLAEPQQRGQSETTDEQIKAYIAMAAEREAKRKQP